MPGWKPGLHRWVLPVISEPQQRVDGFSSSSCGVQIRSMSTSEPPESSSPFAKRNFSSLDYLKLTLSTRQQDEKIVIYIALEKCYIYHLSINRSKSQ